MDVKWGGGGVRKVTYLLSPLELFGIFSKFLVETVTQTSTELPCPSVWDEVFSLGGKCSVMPCGQRTSPQSPPRGGSVLGCTVLFTDVSSF